MKNILYSLFALTLIITSCGDNSEAPTPTDQDLALEALQNGGVSWVIGSTGSVTKDNFDVTSQYADFRLSVGEFTYSVENNTGTAWPNTTGTWQFGNDRGTTVIRDDGVIINQTINNGILTLTFTANDPGGRLSSVSGEYVFVLESE